MSPLLQPGQVVYSQYSKLPCTIQTFLGGGGQGEVYAVDLQGQTLALKWYFPQYLPYDSGLRERIATAISSGAPSDHFLWPLEIVTQPGADTFGYLMPLRGAEYYGMTDLLSARLQPSFQALATAGLQLAHSFLQLHTQGLCYRDISHNNVFFNPETGDILICDNDNVSVVGEEAAVLGTGRFMAPEIVRGEALPNRETDLHALAVLLFWMFIMHHPLEGRRESMMMVRDEQRLYGTAPLFIFDPADTSNHPEPGYQDNALIYWPLYPQFLRDRFTDAFTQGLHDPGQRVAESVWRSTMSRLRDAIFVCSHCQHENFLDLQQSSLPNCWNCGQSLAPPARLIIGKQVIALNPDTQLFPHHINNQRLYDFSQAVGTVIYDPKGDRWGLRNTDAHAWSVTAPDGTTAELPVGSTVRLRAGYQINFGSQIGEIKT
jgi:eukaryotic-like serine/threonine-protein kinase